MDPKTTTVLISLAGGVLGWALGSLIDAYLPRFQIGKSKPLLIGVCATMVAAIIALRF